MMARRSELSGLDLPDLREAGEEGLEAFVRHSKTDQSADGQLVTVPYGQHAETCAVRAVRAWTGVLAGCGMSRGQYSARSTGTAMPAPEGAPGGRRNA